MVYTYFNIPFNFLWVVLIIVGVGKGMTPCKFHKLLSIVEDGSSVSLLEALGHKPPNSLHIGYADNIKATAIAPQLKDVSFNVLECSEVR